MHEIICPKCGEKFSIDEKSYADIQKQIRDKTFEKEVSARVTQAEEVAKANAETEKTRLLAEKDAEIERLKHQVDESQKETQAEVLKAESKKDKEIAEEKLKRQELEAKLEQAESEKKIAVKEAVEEKDKELAQKTEQINSLKETHRIQLEVKEKEIEQIRDFKKSLSTKMVGESLEQHCEIEFNKIRMTAFPNAYFEKDNDAKSGSKGDYIFRDYVDSVEYISIMFEMKNESDETKTKHKNADFFDKLDKDRNEKGCEYAVLVSMLEADNEFYNQGIVDVSYKYPKMYVIRPQFFISLITLLRNAAQKTAEYRKQLVVAQNQNIDLANFEKELKDAQDKFGHNYRLASDRFKKAIEEIDKTIKQQQKTRDALQASENNLRLANDKAQELSVKKLVKGKPTLLAQYEQIKAEKGEV